MKRFFLFVFAIVSMSLISCGGDGDGAKFKMVLETESEVALDMFGKDVNIGYKIIGAEGSVADVKFSDPSWVRVMEHSSGQLKLRVSDNLTGGSRMVAVTLSYGGSSASVIINQLGEAYVPIITSKSGDKIELERAGSKVRIEYQLENINDKDYIYVKTSADWIYSIDTNVDGYVELGVATNNTKALRSTTVTVGYGVASFDVELSQRGDGDVRFVASVMEGEYYGDAPTPGAGNYWFSLSDRGFDAESKAYPSATYYRIDAYGEVYSGYDTMVPIPNGVYTFDKDNTYAKGTFTAEYSGFWVTNKNGKREGAIATFESGTLVVEDGKITLDVVVDGEAHHVEYVGNTSIYDAQDTVTVYSTLTGDYEADLSNHSLIYECYGDYYEFGYTNWMIVIMPNDGSGDCFQFDFITGYTTPEEGFCGEYVSSDYLAQNSFIPGWTDGKNLLCSWFFTADQKELAPFRGGNMSIKDNGDGTVTVDIDVKDDLRNRITATWTGTPIENQ